ncbi:hypothetical protein DL770_007925 [Monosporascus sp. CRB-9-2]|nr:hypothetical protein DL770_007925 [Monosporascus sp. CRB-9-2]
MAAFPDDCVPPPEAEYDSAAQVASARSGTKPVHYMRCNGATHASTGTVGMRSQTPPICSASHLAIPPDTPYEVRHARRSVLTNIKRLQTLLMGPDDLIQNLASQVLACIPLNDTVPTKDIADLMGVPETELSRIVRMTSTVGFLAEPRPGYIAHTALSAPYVNRLNYLDAAMDRVTRPGRRQWPAFLRCLGDRDDSVTEVLSRLDWLSLGNACEVDLCAQSTKAATALADLFPALHFVVQLPHAAPAGQTENGTHTNGGGVNGHGERISVQRRAPGSPQTVKDAAVYMLRTPSPPRSLGQDRDLAEHILVELRAHLGVLRANAAVTFVLALQPLPDPGSVGVDVEAMACVRDLSKMQLTNEREMQVGEVVQMVDSVQDGVGRLAVVNKLLSPNSATVALVVKYHFDS